MDKILTSKQMQQRYEELNKQGFVPPYFYKITKGKQILYFLGFKHTFDPYDQIFKKLHQYWEEFLRETSNDDAIVLQEGGKRPVLENEEEAILRGGESHLMAYLATQQGIFYDSPEPTDQEEIESLLKKFTKEEIFYYFIASVVDQWHRGVKKRLGLEDYLELFFSRYKKESGWEDFDFTLDHFIEIHNQTHNHKFDPDNKMCFYVTANPSESAVADVASRFRDEHILSEILKYWNQGKSIFVVYGSGHAIKLEKAIKSLAE